MFNDHKRIIAEARVVVGQIVIISSFHVPPLFVLLLEVPKQFFTPYISRLPVQRDA
jgi:hypothetical protein